MSNPTLSPFTAQELKDRQPRRALDPDQNQTPPKIGPERPAAPTKPSVDHHPRKFDRETYNQITGLDARLLEAIAYDSRCQSKHSPTGARYSVKPQAYFARLLGVCRETISDAVRKLARIGILDITRRRKKHGVWQSNMYRIRSWMWWRLGKALRALRTNSHRVTQTSHITNPMREITNQEDLKGGALSALTQKILAEWTARGMILGET